jgi:hypothetical protein
MNRVESIAYVTRIARGSFPDFASPAIHRVRRLSHNPHPTSRFALLTAPPKARTNPRLIDRVWTRRKAAVGADAFEQDGGGVLGKEVVLEFQFDYRRAGGRGSYLVVWSFVVRTTPRRAVFARPFGWSATRRLGSTRNGRFGRRNCLTNTSRGRAESRPCARSGRMQRRSSAAESLAAALAEHRRRPCVNIWFAARWWKPPEDMLAMACLALVGRLEFTTRVLP